MGLTREGMNDLMVICASKYGTGDDLCEELGYVLCM